MAIDNTKADASNEAEASGTDARVATCYGSQNGEATEALGFQMLTTFRAATT